MRDALAPLSNHPSRPDRVWRSQAAMNEPIRREIAKAYAEAIARRPSRCPWNPFPADSRWGKAIDEEYRRERARETPSKTDLEALLKAAPNREVWLEAKRQYMEASDVL